MGKLPNQENIAFHKNYIPITYMWFGFVFLFLASVFATLHCIWIFTDTPIINPWISLMCGAGSLGLFITVLAAVKEWRTL